MTKARDLRKTERQEASRLALIEMLKLDLESRGEVWDEQCCLCFLYEEDDGWHVSSLDLPDDIWRPHPAAGLATMAGKLKPIMKFLGATEATRRLKPATWRGVAFFSETWMVEQKKSHPGEKPDPVFEEMARARMLSQHPARVEARAWWAALSDGSAVSVIMRRDGDPEEKWGINVFLPGAGDKEKPDFQGQIPESLAAITKVLSDP